MKLSTPLLSLLLLISGGFGLNQAGAVDVNSMTNYAAPDVQVPQPELRKWEPDQQPLPRNYVQQPPLIPHQIEGYQINQKFNKCLTCHSWANYKAARATKISPTHFTDRDGVDLANVSARRYFCTQCHIPQQEVTPLVENSFQPIQVLQGQ
jgi:nitrate reductase (cytochrome), electron transfer subunit